MLILWKSYLTNLNSGFNSSLLWWLNESVHANWGLPWWLIWQKNLPAWNTGDLGSVLVWGDLLQKGMVFDCMDHNKLWKILKDMGIPDHMTCLLRNMYAGQEATVCCSMSSSNCCFLTCLQVSQEAGQVVWYSHLSEFSTVYCDPHSQRLWHSLQSRNRSFPGTLLLFWWSSRCWQFYLWFLCLF